MSLKAFNQIKTYHDTLPSRGSVLQLKATVCITPNQNTIEVNKNTILSYAKN
jgi:hypothetical protein